jgi:FkbM family methyltransferase
MSLISLLIRIRLRLRRHFRPVEAALRKARLLEKVAPLRGLPAKPVFLDVGARDGLAWEWAELTRRGLVQGVAVELDRTECKRLQQALPPLICLPFALGPEPGKRTLYITRSCGCSSFLEPDYDMLQEYEVRSFFDVLRTVEIDVVRYADLVKDRKAPRPTFVKLDVQGFEKEVLKGFGTVLDDVIAIELEAHFRPLYHGQLSAAEMIEQMRSWGFILRDIRQQGPFEGEFVEGNFYFSRLPKKLEADRAVLLRVWENIERIPAPPAYVPVPEGNSSTVI